MSRQHIYDHVIIGAGASGLYTGYKLRKKYPNDTILILESSNILGGRARNIDWNGVKINVGAEHVRNTDKYLLDLIKEIGEAKVGFYEKKINVSNTTKNDAWVKEKIEKMENFLPKAESSRHFYSSEKMILNNNIMSKIISFISFYKYISIYIYTSTWKSCF